MECHDGIRKMSSENDEKAKVNSAWVKDLTVGNI